MPMFSPKHAHYGYNYNIPHNQQGFFYMGNRNQPGSPYPIFPSPMYGQYHQQPFVESYHQPNLHTNWNVQQVPNQNPYFSSFLGNKSPAQSIFQNPLEPKNTYPHYMQMSYQPMNLNPYPKPNMIPRPKGGIGSIMNSFKGQDGNLDLNKMINTAGQMMNAVSQVSSMVKGLGGIFKA